MRKRKIVSAISTGILLMMMPYYTLQAQDKDPVSVTIKILRQNGNPAQIPFDPDRPLLISDFQGKPDRSSKGVGATRSGIEMNISGLTQNNHVAIEIELFVYFDKQKSWIKEAGKDARILNHEQHHFDITALQLCKFIREINTYPFSATAWNTQLRNLYKKNMRALQELQNRYDLQTGYGTNLDVQNRYDAKITKELEGQDCFLK